jgi:hypothetical protein
MIKFVYRFYDRSKDGLLIDPPILGPYYDEDFRLRETYPTEESAKGVILSLSDEDKHLAYGLILVQEIVND